MAADGTRDGGFTDADRGLVDSAGLTLFGETNKQLSVKLPDYDLADVSIVIDGTGFEVRGRGFETVRKDDFYEAVSAAKTLLDSAKADHEALNEQLDAGEKNKRGNYYIADPEALIAGTPKVRFARNKKAIETYETLIEENREPTEEERDALAGYIGWGSFGQELFQGSWDKPVIRDGWEKEQEWLRDHLGESAWKSAQNSIINAHYTDPPTVGAMWDMVRRLGFKGGRTLEPSTGIGNFLGLMPRDLMELSSITGIELDEMTGNMAKILYPDANIQIKGYQDSKTADDFYDLVIGNWPFAKDGPADRRYNKFNLSLHDYFFVKALDQVRPGGLVIGITSSGTMDKISRMARVEMNRRAVLVDAFRMPMGAFEKYAGTSVVADIIILQKRGTGVEDTGKAWRESVPMRDQNGQPVTTRDGKPVNVNEFWLANPDNVLGNMTVGHGTTFGREGMIVERRDDYAEVLAKLAERLPEAIMTAREHHDNISYITNNTNDRQNSVIVENDKLYVVKGEHLAPVEDLYKYAVKDEKETAKREDQIKRLVGLRKAYGGLLDAERAGLDNTERLRSLLNKQYQDFVKTHGPINKSKALAVFKKVQDPFYPAMASLEVKAGNPKKPVYQPAAILTQSTIRTRRKIDKPSVVDAFIMVRNEDAAFIDIERVAELAKVPAEQAARQLIGSGALFQTPAGNYEVRDIYLSGNVRRKLREAIEAQEAGDEAMTVNIEALKKVLPKDTPYFAIEVSMGSNWVTADQYRQFIADLLGITGDDINDIDVKLMPKGWRVKLESWMNNKPEAQNIWGIPNYPFSRIVNSAFNGSLITIKAKDADGNEFVDEERTKAANEKVDALREEFKSWAWKDPERRVAMERAFNESVNAFANPDFDGSFMRFDGMSLQLGDKPFNLRQHQANAIWRGVANGRGLYAHEVGTGKTFTIAGIAIESRRYGVAKKPLIIAHNANSASVAADTQAMYPGAKVLYVDNLSPATIEQKLYQIANDDWDAVVVPHSLLDRFALTRESLMEMAESEIMALEEEAIASAEEEGFDIAAILDDEDELRKVRGASTAKELVKQRNKIIETINKMAERASRADAIPFEQLGIDMLIVDEAHEFKKPPLTTRMRVKGLNASPSKEGIAMHFLTSYIRKVNGGKGVHLFTGTPITNTLNEIYNQMRYVMGDAMEEANVAEWDAWFNTFAGIVSDVELTSTGEYEAVSRLSGFYNVSELRRFAGQYMDIVFADEMPEFVPRPTASGKTLQDTDLTEAEREELLNGRSETPVGRPYKKVINETAPMTDVQRNILNELVRLARMFKAADRKTRRLLRNHKSNPVLVETAAAQAAFDPRLRDMNAPDLPDYKANRVVNNVMNHYKEHKLATQVIFMDKGYNDKAERTIYGPDGFRMTNLEGQSLKETVPTFNVSKDIVAKLVAQGIPKEEIAVVTGSTSKEKRKEIADKMNRAEIRVVIGMTATLGVGVNMQENLRAIHHLDAPWMPGELEQRNGRGHRQGNKWNTVLEYRYLTEGIDGRRWQVLAVKQKFITAFLQADEDTRVIEGDAVDMSGEGIDDISESLSAAAGDPRLLMREKLKSDVNKLENKQRTHDFGVTDAIESARKLHRVNEQTEARIKKSAADAEHFQSYKDKSFSIEIKGKTYTDRRAASEAITAASLAAAANQVIGHFKGFEIVQMVRNNEFRLSREDHYESVNTLASIEANLRNIAKHVEKDRERMGENEQSIKRLIEASKTPFAQADMLEKKRTMLTQLEADIEQYPVPAPNWLRTGAPVGTDAFIRDENEALKKVTIEGHRWGSDDYYVLIDDADGTKPVPYQQILDENNTPVYPVMDFSEPVIIEDGAELDDLPPVPVPSQSGGTVTPKGIKAGDTVKAADGTTYTVTRVYEPALNGDRDKEADWQVEVQAGGDEAVIFSANEVTKFSKNQQTFNGSTEKQIRDWLPGRVKGLIDAGKLEIVSSVDKLPAHLKAKGNALYHTVFHGTPHSFDRFSLDHIGSGEGAQAFGHGLYFTDKKEIAEWYRDKLTKGDAAVNGKPASSLKLRFSEEMIVNMFLNRMNARLSQKEARKQTADWAKDNRQIAEDLSPEKIDQFVNSLSMPKGRLYQVELAPKQDEYLDWDKPVPEEVANKIAEQMYNDGLAGDYDLDEAIEIMNIEYGDSGKMLYQGLSESLRSDKAASDYLHALGIRGIRYKAESGLSEANNYVIFSDGDATITAKFSQALSDVEALYDERADKLYLVADMLTKDTLNPVLNHELFHRAEATDEKLKTAIDKFDADLRKRFFAASKGRASDIEQAAYRRVMDAGTREKDRLSEFKAYLVTEWSQNPDTFTGTVKKMILDFIAAIRAALFRAGMPLKSITPADLAALAKYGARVNKNAMQPARTGSRKFRASFAGAKARTADTHQLDTAQQRLAKGDDPETIRQETGWHKGADGKWRFEINDKDATLKPLREGEQGARYRSDALENVIDHPALFAAYPGLRDLLVNITVDPDTQSEQGSYADGTEGDDYSFGREPEINVTARTPKKALSTLLHEIQHGIQYIEDFATGGSPGEFTRQIQARPYEGLTNYLGYLQRYSDAPIEFSPSDIQRYESLENFFDDYRLPREITNRMAPDEDIEWGIDLGYDFEEGMEIATILEILADDARRDIEKGTSGPTPFEQYQRLAGEVEARNTQARQTMTDAERKATSPGATQDIANSEVIVAFNGRAMDSAPQPLNATAKSGAKGGRVRFSTAPALYTQAWLNWFGRSKMKRGGAPIKFYHGTNHDFTIFDKAKLAGSTQHSTAGLGFFFTENAEEANRYGSTVHEVYLSIEKPYVTHSWLLSENFEDADGAARFRAKLQQQGYDGIYIKDAGYVVAFESPQVKLTGNKNPSPFDDDIRYSRRSSGGAINDARRQGDAWLKGFLNQQNWDKAIYNLQDRYIDLKRQMEKVVSRGEAIEEFEDARMGEELYHQRTASRVKEFYDQDLGPVLKALHDNRVSLDAFQKFLHARHAPSRNEVMAERNPNQDIIDRELARAQKELEDLKQTAFTPRAMQKALKEVAKWERAKPFAGTEEERLSLSGMSNRESADIIAAFAPEERRLMDMLGDEIDRINNETLDLMVEYGMEKPKTIQALKKQWEHYVPLHRDEAHPENSNFGHPIGRGFSVRGSGMKNATGSQAQVTNILAHIAAAREQMLTRGEKNRVQMRLAHFIDNHPDPDFATIGKVPMDDKLVNGLVETLPDTNYKNRDNVVVFRVKGRDVAIVFNENKPENVRLALSLKNMDGVDLDKVESIIAKGTRWIAAFNTQYNVVFGVVNLIRDAQGMLLNLSSTPLHGKQKDVFNHMGRALSVIAAVERGWRQGDAGLKAIYDRFNKAGGTTGYRQMFDDVSDRDRTLRDELAKFEAGPVKRGRQWLGKALTDFNTVMENSTRLAVFMTGLEAGLSDDKAASLAKNITVNFNRKGAYTTKLGAFYAFFNASMQGTARMGETLTGPKGKQILVGGVGLGAALTLLGIAAMGADDWEKIPEFVRERSLIVPVPWNKSGYIAIPMPLGFHLLPNIGRKLVESAFGSNRLSTTERFTQLAGSVIGAFNPMGGHDISEVVMPTVLDPALALWRNQDWTGRAIYREDFNSLKPTPGFKRTKDTASWPSRQLAEGINKLTGGTDYKAGAWSPTPDQIDYVFGQLFGGTGREILKAGQLVESSVTGEELPTYKIPLLGRLYGETSGNAVERSAYYDNLRRLNEHEAELKGLRSEPGGSQKAAAYLRANPDARLVLKVKRAQKAIDHIRDRRRDLVRLGASPDKLRILDDRMAKIMKQLNDSVAKTLGS